MMNMKLPLLVVLLAVLQHAVPSTAFVVAPGSSSSILNGGRTATTRKTLLRFYAKSKKKEPAATAPYERPPNEFSRTYRVESVLSGGHRQRDYNVAVQATAAELSALAGRFDLNQIYSLEAALDLRRERSSPTGVEVEGTVTARVDQVCVRTGEIFDVDVQFPLFAIVRPIASASASSSVEPAEEVPQEVADYEERMNKQNNKKKKNKRLNNKTPLNLKDMDMNELQNLLQDFDVEDDVMEDEGIYESGGMIDIGELVAQLFWLKLDPYPKKPGSSPVQSSISG